MAFQFPKISLPAFFMTFWRKGYQSLMRETPLVDFKMRNLFSARIRIVLFLLSWVLLFVFYPEIWVYKPAVPFALCGTFLLTAFGYWYLFREQHIFVMTLLVIVADALAQAVLVFVLGYDGYAPILIFGLYVLGAGMLFGYFMAILAAVISFLVYLGLFVVVKLGVVDSFYYPVLGGGLVNIAWVQGYFAPLLLPLILGFLVYALRIVSYFAQIKQKALERRHVQLAALNNIGSTIRKTLNSQDVMAQVLRAVIKGLRFETCFLVLLDDTGTHLRFYTETQGYYAQKMKEILGVPVSSLTLSLGEDVDASGNAIRRSMDKGRVVIRNHFSDVLMGLMPRVSFDKSVMTQSYLGLKKFVITPLIAEQKAIGAIVGVSVNPYIEDTVIDTLEHFSNQAALAIESAQLFEKLHEKNEQLQRANKVKSDFLAIMSHELRTPLFAVIGYSEILLDRILGDMSAEQKKSVVEILRNAKNLLELINNVLDLSKLESGKMDLNFENFDWLQLAQNVAQTLKPLVDKKRQDLAVDVTGVMPPMIADPVKIRQILINLIGNAVKFTPDSGRIRVRAAYFANTESVREPSVLAHPDFANLRNRPVFVFSVKDSGVGIAPDDQKVIFESFRQADNSFTRAHEGTGLGLALTKQLVLLHAGLIAVASTLGEGSEFFVVIPQKS